jgi:capsular polysaccharide biosynthesis protein
MTKQRIFMNDNEKEYEIDFTQILDSIKKFVLPIIIICIVTSILSLLVTTIFIDKKYKATGKIIVVQSLTQDESQLSYDDVIMSQKLVDTYTEILLSDRIGDIVIEKIDTDLTTGDYKNQLIVTSVNDTEVINVSIETSDPKTSAAIVNTTLDVFKDEISSIMSIENVSILDEAKIPSTPSSPNIAKNTLIGLLIGILISGVVVLYDVLKNNFIKDEDELKDLLGIPVIGIIPEHQHNVEAINE